MFTKGLPLGKRPIYCGRFSPDTLSCFFPVWQWEDFLNYNRGMAKMFSCVLDDIKVFEPSEEVDSTVEMTVRCYRWCERTKLHTEFPVWVGHYSRQKITENPTPHVVYLKMTRGVDWHPKPKQAEKETERKCLRQKKKKKKKGQEISLWQNYN